MEANFSVDPQNLGKIRQIARASLNPSMDGNTETDFKPIFTVQQILDTGTAIIEAEQIPENPDLLDYVACIGLWLYFQHQLENAHLIVHLHQVTIFRAVRSGIQLATIGDLLALQYTRGEDQ